MSPDLKIVILMRSPNRKGSTNMLVENFVKGAEEAEQIDLYEERIGFCRACYACFKTGKCVLQDDMAENPEKGGKRIYCLSPARPVS